MAGKGWPYARFSAYFRHRLFPAWGCGHDRHGKPIARPDQAAGQKSGGR
jgi:hypothetical protein